MDKWIGKLNTRKRIYLILILGIIAGLIVIGVHLHGAGKKQEEAPVATTSAPEPTKTPTKEPTKTPTPTPTEPEKPPVDGMVDFGELWAVNEDVYAYLYIPDTEVSYPVLQSSAEQEEDYYLDHTVEGAQGLPGSLYSRKETQKDFSDAIAVIYGHDMLNGSFFGGLASYEDAEYLNAHDKMYVYLPGYRLEYKVVAEGVYGDDSVTAKFDCTKKVAIRSFLKDLESFDEMVKGKAYREDEEEPLLVLSTCIGPRPNNRRLVVGRLVEKRRTKP